MNKMDYLLGLDDPDRDGRQGYILHDFCSKAHPYMLYTTVHTYKLLGTQLLQCILLRS